MTEKNSAGFEIGGGFFEKTEKRRRDYCSKIRFGFGDKYGEPRFGTIRRIFGVSKGRPLTLKPENEYLSFRYYGYGNKLTSYYELDSAGAITHYKNFAQIDEYNVKMKNPNEDPWTEYIKIYRGEAKRNIDRTDKIFSERITDREPILDACYERYYLGHEKYFELILMAIAARPDLKKEILAFLPEKCRPYTFA